MWFGEITTKQGKGAILAHSFTLPGFVRKKGHVLTQADIDAFLHHDVAELMVAKLDHDDIGENQAADQIGAALLGTDCRASRASTGRVNFFAAARGVLAIQPEKVAAFNRMDTRIALACRRPFQVVEDGEIIATLKIIPFAIPEDIVVQSTALAGAMLSVNPFIAKRAVLVQTIAPGMKESILDKTHSVLSSRLSLLDCHIVAEERIPHRITALVETIQAGLAVQPDIILLSGASAIVDIRDTLPEALRRAGGEVIRFGMPVEPGNLLLFGRIGDVLVLGLPGCARSPKFNGIDLVLARLCAGVDVTSDDIATMGAGGLLSENRARVTSHQRKAAEQIPVAAVILGAGMSRRMGKRNKLLIPIDGIAMIRHAAMAALGSRAARTIVVTGHQEASIRSALRGLPVEFVKNPDYPEGVASSIRHAMDFLRDDATVQAAMFLLGDMPFVGSDILDRMIQQASLCKAEARILVPTCGGKRGNPVLFPQRFFRALAMLLGDRGGRTVTQQHSDEVVEVAVDDLCEQRESVLIDVDAPENLRELTGAEDIL